MSHLRLAMLLSLSIVAFACGRAEPVDVDVDDAAEVSDDAQGLSTDVADRNCQVVLRHAERTPGTTGGYQVTCNSGGVCYYQWQGFIDVALEAKKPGSTVWVQYKSTDATTWSKKQASQVAGGPTGFQRYAFKLDSKTVSAGMSPTSLQRARLTLLPYLKQSDGGRLFDHNRVSDDFGSYALVVNNQWAIGEDAAVCRPLGSSRAVLEFKGDFTQVQRGPLLQRGNAVIEYDLNRLPACRGTHNGYPAWDTIAKVKFEPQGTTIERSVRTFDAPSGIPNVSTLRSLPFEFTIPLGTQRVQVWFFNTGIWCTPSYDSNQGSNYWFDVSTTAPVSIGWVGGGKASTSRECVANRDIPEPIVLDGYIRERACSFVEMETWAQGLTDAVPARPELMLARAEASLDGTALPTKWLQFVGQIGNNYRYRFDLPRDELYYGSRWSTLTYTLGFSTDGVIWVKDVPRTVTRDPSWCNPAWGSCGS